MVSKDYFIMITGYYFNKYLLISLNLESNSNFIDRINALSYQLKKYLITLLLI